ncbi:MAG: 1-acyl-sn-glycerol-3-phosphate acyltransferase [Bacteroidota bacterium]
MSDKKENIISDSGANATEKFIDIDEIIRSKNPRLAKFLPRFIVNYIKRIICQDFINDFIDRNKTKVGLDFVEAIVQEFTKEVKVIGRENIPAEGRGIIVSNHPLGGLDGIALLHEAGKVRKEIVFPVNDILMNLKNLAPLFIPINKHGSNSENIRIIEDTFASDKMMVYFPAGLVSRKQKGVIKDLDWKKTVIAKARKHKRDIIPALIDGQNSSFFYNFANFRKKSGIKQNIEMIYLPGEMMKQKIKSVNIIFGKPVPWTLFDKRFNDTEWASKLKDYVYSLRENPTSQFPY